MNTPFRQRAPSRLALLPGLLGLGALLLTAVGCDDSGGTEPVELCTTSQDCVDPDTGEPTNQLCNVDRQCVACTGDAECQADAIYGSTSTCVDGACVACPDGDTGCACLEGDTCNTGQGQCMGGTCVDCDKGELDCICRDNGTCLSGNVCDDANNLCVTCEGDFAGTEGCACDETDATSCGEGLVCDGGTCVVDTCVDGAVDCPCSDDGTCSSTETYCNDGEGGDGLCRQCSADIAGCPCDPGDVCSDDALYCDPTDTTCAVCTEGSLEETCVCDSTSTDAQCGDGFVCDGDSTSQTYNRCRAPLTCADLTCADNFACTQPLADNVDVACCTADSDPADCPELCVDGYTWDTETTTCVPVVAGESCEDTDGNPTSTRLQCEANLQICVDDADGNGQCIDTCASLDCAAEFKDCTLGATDSDPAVCAGCLPGYADDGAGVCVRDTAANCSTAVGAANSIYEACRARNQQCVPDATNGAICGDCVSGYEVNALTGLCTRVEACGNDICTDTEYCFYPADGAVPYCADKQCSDGQAWDETSMTCLTCDTTACSDGEIYPDAINGACACAEDVFCEYEQTDTSRGRCFVTPCEDGEAHSLSDDSQTCTACGSLTCGDDAGEGTRTWPVRDRSGLCMCETQQGYYFPTGGAGVPLECDADADGWITASANSTYVDASTSLGGEFDDGRLANFRCDRRVIDEVYLNNEYGQTRVVALCSNGVIENWAPGEAPSTCFDESDRVDIVLFENNSLDSDNGLAGDADPQTGKFPPYGGRQLLASEVNGLTKACVSINADYNANGVEDLKEAQPRIKADRVADTGDSSDEGYFFGALSYFTELHRGHYEPNTAAPGSPGAYVITERNRCDTDDFQLTTDVGPSFYWQSCLRLRDSDYDYASGSQVHMDFARFNCSDQTSYCEPLPDPDFLSTGTNLDGWSGRGDRVVDHDLCALQEAAAPDALDLPDTPWLGMSHHSQFRCVQVASTTDDFTMARNLLSGGDTTGNAAAWDFNNCTIADTTPGVDQPATPEFDCQYTLADSTNVPDDTVGLVSALYAHYGHPTYVRGCIAEANLTYDGASFAEGGQGYKALCPGFDENPEGVDAASNPGDFGKLICTCKEQYGGANCEVACASRGGNYARLHTGGPPNLIGETDLIGPDEEADFACDIKDVGGMPVSAYCLTYPPVPSAGFLGGRRGYWMCGEFTATRPADPTNPLPFFEGTYTDAGGNTLDVQIDGNIRMVPVQRSELTGNIKICDDGQVVGETATCTDGSAGNLRAVSLF